MKLKEISFVHVETKEELMDGISYTEVTDKNGEHLADIFFLEDDDYKYRYSVELPSGFWLKKSFDTEAEAIEAICGGIKPLIDFGDYYNSERGHLQHMNYGK